jgi:hypothetical protein
MSSIEITCLPRACGEHLYDRSVDAIADVSRSIQSIMAQLIESLPSRNNGGELR